jgi:hypothetical protein
VVPGPIGFARLFLPSYYKLYEKKNICLIFHKSCVWYNGINLDSTDFRTLFFLGFPNLSFFVTADMFNVCKYSNLNVTVNFGEAICRISDTV